METLLIATDFSANAKHAANYGYMLASSLGANLILCNSFIVPAEVPDAGFVTWPIYEYDELLKDNANELTLLKNQLEQAGSKHVFKPHISCVNEVGAVADVVNAIAEKNKIKLIVVGTHLINGLSQFLIGNHTRRLIDDTTRPLLLVPASTTITPIKKVAFATDFKDPEKEMQAIYELINLIRPLNAQVLVTHIHDEKKHTPVFEKWLGSFLSEISEKANYPHLHYRVVLAEKPDGALDWLCEHGHIDVLAMMHRKHSFFEGLINGSHTQKMAGHIKIPLLVMPSH
ncbi:universal stress protein [Mucilaginibacter xinganensis]|uniref:Universal stress protein UspE n=1 Tax=Mucilaginibacter xinganensis TaxID=1234841 RepID=A0A223NY76_9SPHI|nr:universal stress protein [Mucilaginibacter xinganensis]ASU34776.1 universal stress protein UspE [Mucilaginibacter xinganensis]